MVYDYVVTLQNRSRRLVDRFSLLTVGVSLLLFITQFILDTDKRWIHIIGAVLLIGLLAINAYKQRKNVAPVHYNSILMITGVVWASMPFLPWLSILFIVMGLLEKQAKKNLEIGFHEDRIVFNSFPRKFYSWSDFSNIVLRDNLLTLDFADNRLFQRETIDDEGDAEEDEFNAYCRARLP